METVVTFQKLWSALDLEPNMDVSLIWFDMIRLHDTKIRSGSHREIRLRPLQALV